MSTSKTITVTADDDCTEAEYVDKVTLGIKGMLLGLPRQVQIEAILKLIQGLDADLPQAIRDQLQQARTLLESRFWLNAIEGSAAALEALQGRNPDLLIERNKVTPTVLVVTQRPRTA